ncbi:MAG: phospholipase D-like domain-containing protein [Nitrosomonas sp.]|nr:phospholipase D-like domain-containing protein [Nitrosomonas sp.]
MARFIGQSDNVITLRYGVFSALESAIDSARQEIHLETYIFQYDATGARIAAALKRAAQRGVAVHLLIDGFGSLGLSRIMIQEMLAAGVQVLIYRQEFFHSGSNVTACAGMHRKLAVMDAVAFVGNQH